MVQTIYIIILAYFLLGSIGFYFLNRRKEPEAARKSWTKFTTYFIIINVIFFSIVINSVAFQYLSVLITGIGFLELFKLYKSSGFRNSRFFLLSVFVFGSLATGFIFFSRLDKGLILFSFLILSIFDSFSQITGQLWGHRKILPRISPNKTAGGVIGGAIIAILSSFVLHGLYNASMLKTMYLVIGILIFAFTGDLAASLYKRKYAVKDYSNLLPGHGGFLDRFDSLIAGGAWVSLSVYALNF